MGTNPRQQEIEKLLLDLIHAKYSDAEYAARFASRLMRGLAGGRRDVDAPRAIPWGWAGTWAEFLLVSERRWLRSLLFHHQERWKDLPLDSWQIWTWRVEFRAFRALLMELCKRRPEVRDALVVFEYEIPFEDGHRPDAVLVLPSGHAIIVECKNRETLASADRKQVMMYLDALHGFHSQSGELSLHAVVLLLQPQKRDKGALGDANVLVACFDGFQVPALDEYIEKLLAGSQMLAAPVEWLRGEFTPRNEVRAEFIRAAQEFVDHTSKRTADATAHNAFLSWSDALAEEAKSRSEHKLVLVSAAPTPELLALKFVLGQAKKGARVLFLRGDSPDADGLARLVKSIDSHSDSRPARAVVRGLKMFFRYSSWSDYAVPAHVYAVDQAANTIWLRPEVVLDVASRSDWAVVVVFLDDAQPGRRDDVSSWISQLLFFAETRAKDWTVFTPKQFGFPNSLSEVSRIRVRFRPELAFGREPLATEGAEDESVCLEQLLKPYLWGQLRKFPANLKTWEQVTEGLATRGYSVTPLRDAAKYGGLEHIPPESCAEHFEEAKSIVIKSVEDSRADGRFERRVEARRWLIKAALAGGRSSEEAIVQALQTIDELVAEGISFKRPPAVFGTSLNAQPQSPEDLLRRFVRDGEESLIDMAVAERFLSWLSEHEPPPRVDCGTVSRDGVKASLPKQVNLELSEGSPNEPF